MYSSEGIITARGGVTSHAAVVARGIGKPCICSVENVIIANDTTVSINGLVFNEGDYITIDGSSGQVFEGYIDMTPTAISNEFMTILSWMDRYKNIDVMANAETPEDVKTAITFGASGIGLCRTEHMFFGKERINDVRRMILAGSESARKDILVKLGQYQKEDFLQLFEILDGKPLCVRLLDPPLHEFLPQTDDDIKSYCQVNNESFDQVKSTIKSLHEYNPMLGHRGVRLGVTHRDIYECQVRAIFEAAAIYSKDRKIQPKVEIMIPLIFSENELVLMKDMIEKVKISCMNAKDIDYKFGAMIELPRIALVADRIANYVDFISFGTNDLTQTTFGVSRDDSGKFLNEYLKSGIINVDPFASIDRDGVGQLMKIAIEKIKTSNPSVKIGICGEHGGDEESIKFFHEVGCDYISCSPYRVPAAKLTVSKIN
jgi:pyruvate,orthophosphate dikinase